MLPRCCSARRLRSAAPSLFSNNSSRKRLKTSKAEWTCKGSLARTTPRTGLVQLGLGKQTDLGHLRRKGPFLLPCPAGALNEKASRSGFPVLLRLGKGRSEVRDGAARAFGLDLPAEGRGLRRVGEPARAKAEYRPAVPLRPLHGRVVGCQQARHALQQALPFCQGCLLAADGSKLHFRPRSLHRAGFVGGGNGSGTLLGRLGRNRGSGWRRKGRSGRCRRLARRRLRRLVHPFDLGAQRSKLRRFWRRRHHFGPGSAWSAHDLLIRARYLHPAWIIGLYPDWAAVGLNHRHGMRTVT